MRKTSKRLLIAGLILLLVAAIPGLGWVSLTHKPGFYRAMIQLPRDERAQKAKRFMAQSLQLRNDICNEPTWEAVFSDQEVNAWLAEDLVTHFADQLPPEVHEPRVVFELDRVTLAFELDSGPLSSVIWVVARPRVPEGNVVELTLEKIRAGVLPVPPERVLDRITEYVRERGLDVQWRRGDEGFPVVTLRYTPDTERDDVQLEQVHVRHGQIRLAGRSNHDRGIVRSPRLPTRKVLQSKFPRRKVQARADSGPDSTAGPDSGSPAPTLHNSTRPTS
jgi:hypothetical protein